MVVRQSLGKEFKEELEDGNVLLFERNGIFQARVYRGDRKYIYRSLKTRKLAEARKAALKFYYEIQFKQEQELPLQQKSFNAVIDEYIALRSKSYEQSKNSVVNSSREQTTSIYMLRQIKRVSRFWREYCGKMAVDKIDNVVLQDYVSWRKDYYHRLDPKELPRNVSINPADMTLQWEVTLGKTLLRFAQEKGYRGKAALPTWSFKGAKRIVRPAFTLPEYTHLYKSMRRWVREATNEKWRYTREMLRDYILILSNSGMRVGEANNLKESDVIEFKDDMGRKNYMFMVKGKTGKRTVVPRTNAARYVERVLKRNQEWRERWEKDDIRSVRKAGSVRTQGYEDVHKKDTWLFRMSDGGKVITLIDQFKVLLGYCGLEKNRYGEHYTLYSLRHFYAVQMLRGGKVGVFDIARNMGTSVQMIETYYGKDATPIALATKLGG